MEEKTTEFEENKSEVAKRWVQDNLRIIVSVVIVVAIAGGIYSYSKRTENLATNVETSEEVASLVEEGASTSDEAGQVAESVPTQEEGQTQEQPKESAPASKETETSFVETAGAGDGSTHLARRAVANYLEKNPDSALTKEHKIYMEDYLRKVAGNGQLSVGSSMEFSKDMIKDAIEKSKQLNENQLKNLQKYSARVSSLT